MTMRPTTLAEVAERSDTMAEFGLNFTDWLHEIRRLSSRAQLEATYAREPRILADRFPEGGTADAWLAAYAEHVASLISRGAPAWAFQPRRVSDKPWFSDVLGSASLREGALSRSPLAFKRRNLYATRVELPLRLRRGRPRVPEERTLRMNAERQRRFRTRRNDELKRLRALVAESGIPPGPGIF